MKIEISKVANLPTKYWNFKIQSFKEGAKEHLVIYKEPLSDNPIYEFIVSVSPAIRWEA